MKRFILIFLLVAKSAYALDIDQDTNTATDVTYGGTNAATASAARTNLGVAIGSDVQEYDADLTTWASITPSANIQSFNSAADYDAAADLLLDNVSVAPSAGSRDYSSVTVTLPANVVDSAQYVDGSIDVEHLSDSSVGTVTASKAAGYTIGTDDGKEAYGGTIYVTSAATIVAPAVSARMNFTVVTIGAIAVSLDVNASDRMYLDGVALDDGDKATNTSTTGDIISCSYESAAGWYCASGSPDGDHWTDGGA